MKFNSRTTAPSKNNNYYYKYNIFYKCGYGMPNCTCYAWGRFYELSGKYPKLCTANAENWYKYNDGYERGNTPRLGAVIVWSKGKIGNAKDGAGHVAIVEGINDDGSILTSNSGYKSTNFYLKRIPKGFALNGYKFEGFIYNPVNFDNESSPKPVETKPEPVETKKYIQINARSGVWCRKGIGFKYSKYKAIPCGIKCELISKNVGTANGYKWDKIIYNGVTVYLPNNWNKYL